MGGKANFLHDPSELLEVVREPDLVAHRLTSNAGSLLDSLLDALLGSLLGSLWAHSGLTLGSTSSEPSSEPSSESSTCYGSRWNHMKTRTGSTATALCLNQLTQGEPHSFTGLTAGLATGGLTSGLTSGLTLGSLSAHSWLNRK